MEINLQELEARIVKLEEAHPKLAAAHRAFLDVQTSRRGTTGATGATGAASSVPGPRGADAKIVLGRVSHGAEASANLRDENGTQILDLTLPSGAPGKDSSVEGPIGKTGERGSAGEKGSVDDATRAANETVNKAIAELQRSLPSMINAALKQSGFTEENGKAILLQPKNGVDGRAGVDGKHGESIVGPKGADGVSNVPGPKGDPAEPVNTTALAAQIELRLHVWFTEEILAHLRGHLVESHAGQIKTNR